MGHNEHSKISEPVSSFVKVLRSFQTGGITYNDFLGLVHRQLAAGHSPVELGEVLRRRQLIEPLPKYAHDAIAGLLSGTVTAPTTVATATTATPAVAKAATAATAPSSVAAAKTMVAPLPVVPRHSGAPEKTVVMPRVAPIRSDPESSNTAAQSMAAVAPSNVNEPVDSAAPSASVSGHTPRFAWTVGIVIVIIAMSGGWAYHRHVSSTTSRAVPGAGAPPATALDTAPHAVTLTAPGTMIRDCPTCPEMTVLPVGRFRQGAAFDDAAASPQEKPQHVVLLRRPIAMAVNEVTVDEFREFASTTNRELQGCEIYDGQWHQQASASWLAPGFAQDGNHPATCVSWEDAVAYANWLSSKTGQRYRLPSASEWEYAARAGSDGALPWPPGGSAACENANVADKAALRRYPRWSNLTFACSDGYINTAPVASFKPNAFGINDLIGNVSEWTLDCWHEDYAKAPIDGSARTDGDCSERELRGGSWFSSPKSVRSSYRGHSAADGRTSSLGMRLVRDLPL